ncbi:MAG: PAS domain S-box protein [Methylococcus sp.]|nr:PAS domain S-box protein [Methylococcus sp.]
MTRLELEATVLGRLLVIQETLDVLPDPAGIAAFLDAALAEVPGVEGANLCVDGRLTPERPDRVAQGELCEKPEQIVRGLFGDRFVYPLRIAGRFYGLLIVNLADSEKFEGYRDFVGNIANVVARTLENRAFFQQLADSNRLLEQKIARQTLELSAIVESSDDAIIGKNLDGTISSWNKAAERMYGYRADEISGQPAFGLAPPELRDEIVWYLAEASAGRAVRNLETRRIRKDGSEFDVSLTISPIRGTSGEVVGSSVIARDITEHKQAEATLQRVNRTLKTLSSCNGVLVRATEEPELLQEMCRNIVVIGGYATAWVGLIGGAAHKPSVCYGEGAGFENGSVAGLSCCGTDPVLYGVVESGRSRVLHCDVADLALPPCARRAVGQGYAAVALIPVRSATMAYGVLGLCGKTRESFDDAEMCLLEELADDIAYGLGHLRDQAERLKSADQLSRSLERTIQAVAATLEMRDPYTAGHQRRVADLAGAIARKMGLSEDEIHGVRLAGMVHDLGKIRIPAEILTKPGRLTPLEFDFIKTHPQVGYDILKDVEFPWPIAEIILQHHEKLDGTGYPRGLEGDAILLGARIIMVADVFEALSSHRPYRPGLGQDAALAELRSHRGGWYDECVLDACEAVIRDDGHLLQ